MSNDFPNPYQTPNVNVISDPIASDATLIPATGGQRFANLFIDNIVLNVLSFPVGMVVGAVAVVINGGPLSKEELTLVSLFGSLSGIVVAIVYYVLMEWAFERTVGKFLTGTRVVSVDGGRPTFGQLFGRTLCRFIPFEAFSFLGEVGWHDSISKTRVVKVRS